jgi:hypothetical protein
MVSAGWITGSGWNRSGEGAGRIRWRGVYPGVDVEFHGNQEHLEYDFEIAPRGDPGKIQLAMPGVGVAGPLALPVQVLWFTATGGADALPLFFAGSAPGTVAGIFQINFAAPSASGGAELAHVLGPNTYGASGFFQIYVKQ